ncbi:methanogenic corrinoid protein MtbC1 [Metabacillus crassostreae]|uniref:cobalamin B12-binding domain-containing protein n=1 Tax=Metabacillus crassostreae TaxID=929098 RepID=UPI00195A7A39|nr:cobalamin-dependent protein [Metabacillus crassostreae]MBM7604324.1 methanogenic corrinoid protein MtbC1 [Metabacillus crassostreae]
MTDLTKKFAHFLLLGDTASSYKLVEKLLLDGYSSLYIYEKIIKDALYYIGYLWEIDEIGIADEHLATGTADFIITKLQLLFKEHDNHQQKQAMLFCLEGEEHYIGIKMAANIFKEHNWNVKYLGPNLPLQHAIYFANKSKPDVVCLSLTMSNQLKNLSHYITSLAELDHKPTIIVGSRLSVKYDLTNFIPKNAIVISNLEKLSSWITEQKVLEKAY